MSVFSYYTYFQLASVIVGLLFFKSIRQSGLLWVLFLCTIGFFIDISSRWVIASGHENNYALMNLYTTAGAVTIFWGFWKELKLRPVNNIIYIITVGILSVLFVLTYIYYLKRNELGILPIVFFYFFNVLICCGFLFKMAMRDEIFRFSEMPMFWISAGLLIFSMGALVVMGMAQYIKMNQLTIQNIALYRVIMPVLNVILYSSFAYAFILCRLKKRLYLSLS